MSEHNKLRIKGLGDKIWLYIPCPKKGMQNITWQECLVCTDSDKHKDCPLWAIRSDFTPRGYTKGVYHCTETKEPRRAYYNRITDYAKGWIPKFDAIDFFIGKAIHDRIQKRYPWETREVHVWKDYEDPSYGKFKGTGSVDVCDVENGLLLELKSIMSLNWVIKQGHAIKDHIYQANTYHEWGMYSKPIIFRQLHTLKIVYLCKTKYGPSRYKEYDYKPHPNPNLTENITTLHKAVMDDKPPRKLCRGQSKPLASKFPCGWCAAFKDCLEEWKTWSKP